jgi:hypothetical protein
MTIGGAADRSRVRALYLWLLLLVVAGSLAAGLVASPAGAASGWSRPMNVSEPMNSGEESLLLDVDSAGDATAVWQRYRGGGLVYESAVRQAEGPWSPPSLFFSGLKDAYGLQIAVDSLGNVTSIWERHVGHSWVVQTATRPVGGSWSAPVTLSKPGAGSALIAAGPDGTVTAVWLLEREEGRRSVVQSSTRSAAGIWSEPVSLSPPRKAARYAQIALDPQGSATVVWRSEFDAVIESATRSSLGIWSPPVALSAEGVVADSPQVAVDSEGTATAIWAGRFPAGRGVKMANRRIQVATLPAGGTWSATVNISEAGHRLIQDPLIAVDPQGDATAIWQRSDGENLVVQGATRPAGGSWSVPVELTAGQGRGGQHLQLAMDSRGNATAIWEGYDTRHRTTFSIQGAKRPSGGSWSRAIDISHRTHGFGGPLLAIDPQGRTTALWVIGTKDGAVAQAATSTSR